MTITKSTTSIRLIIYIEREGDSYFRQAIKVSRDSRTEATFIGTPKTIGGYIKGTCTTPKEAY